ncbi:unnamed protein product [Microthlaspi erraticum]|uniref:TFIIS N-terminal domain-containing protein n=1 Tax=Microthlaspi erraticum TaxID=1685480 RepID=A0A6D2KBD5_9BRAS|nr:unnamed protein product [Microthlaspi erraticum]
MRVRIAKERSDLTELVSAVIKTTYDTRSPGGVERCIDALNMLKSLSLSVEDLQWSESMVNLETLRRHRNPKIRKEAQSLFDYWYNTLYARRRVSKACLTQKKSVLKRCSELKKRDERKSVKEERSETHVAVEIKKEEKTGFLDLKMEQDQEFLSTQETEKIKKETENDAACKFEFATRKQEKMRSVTVKAIPQHWRDIKDKDGKITTKSLRPPSRRGGACKDSGNPKSPALKTKTEEELTKKENGCHGGEEEENGAVRISHECCRCG